MQLTVNEARTFGGLKECKLLAGEKGLNRVIRCVDSMEIPDIRQWLQQGEFLVTTGYALKDNSEALVQAVEALADKNGSGLALKTRFIGEISGSVLERAEELGIPIFEMPAEMPTISLTEPLVRRVITGELQKNWLVSNCGISRLISIRSLFLELFPQRKKHFIVQNF